MRTVIYSADALKHLKRHGNAAARIRKAIAEYAADPAAHANTVIRLVGSTALRMRVGDFRVVFEDAGEQLIVTKIGLRGSVCE